MDKTQQTSATDDHRPLAGTDAAFAPPCRGFTLRGRDWTYSATSADLMGRELAAGRGPIG